MSFFDKLKDVWTRLSAAQKVRLGVAVVATLGLVWGFTIFANQVRYDVLFSNLAQEDAGSIVSELKGRQVPYRLSANGTIIEVPSDRVTDLRLELAGEGISAGGGVGYEVFDRPAFGLSEFVQNVNYQRALERELSRTIQDLDAVVAVRVHLALPEPSAFADENIKPSAAVVVRVRSGKPLDNNGVRAIGNLIAGAVEGLDPADVSIIDSDGRTLSAGESSGMTVGQFDGKRAREEQIERTLIALLEPVVGFGKARVRASVELNYTRVDRVEESFDPTGTVRSEQKTKMTDRAGTGAAIGGVPGTASNLPGGPGGNPAAAGARGSESQSSSTSFELNRTVANISEPVGNLVRQSVAVVIDDAVEETQADDGTTQRNPTPRSPEEMRQITSLVRAAIGFDETRNDLLIVENVAFETPEAVVPGGPDIVRLTGTILRYGSLPLGVLLLILFVIRPAIATVRNMVEPHATTAAEIVGPPTVAQLQAQIRGDLQAGTGARSSDRLQPLRRKLMEAISEDPQTAALVVRNWMNED